MIAALIDPDTGRIESFTMPAKESDLWDGQFIGALRVKWDHHNVFGDNPGYGQHTHYFDGEAFVEKAEKPSNNHLYNWSTKAWEWDSTGFWNNVRQIRGIKLSGSDWAVLADSPLTDSKKAEWQTYRTALRDVPAANSSVTDLDNIVWPTQPS
jgi:hypothetical protein